MAFLDLIEFLFRLNKAKMVDTEVWSRWKILAKKILTIPKFKNVWAKTKTFIVLNLAISLFRYNKWTAVIISSWIDFNMSA